MPPLRRSRRVLGVNPDNVGLASRQRTDRSWPYIGILPQDLVPMYKEFNEKYFDGLIVGYTVTWGNKNMKSTYATTDPQQRIIKISPILHSKLMASLGKKKGLKELEGSLLHEMCHAKVFLEGHRQDSFSHGPCFQKEAARVERLSQRSICCDHPSAAKIFKPLRRYTYQCTCGHKISLFIDRMPDGKTYGYHDCATTPKFKLIKKD